MTGKTPADQNLVPESWRDEFEQTAEWALKVISVPNLLVAMWGNFYSTGLTETRSAIAGSFGHYGHRDQQAGRWRALETYLLQHPIFGAHWQRLVAAGIPLRFVEDQDMNRHGLDIVAHNDERSLAAIKRLAKQDMGVPTTHQDKDFERSFDLYLKQNWTADDAERKAWREREPLVEWPWRPKERN